MVEEDSALRVGDLVKENFIGDRVLIKDVDTYSWQRGLMLVYKICRIEYESHGTEWIHVVRADGEKAKYYNWQLTKISHATT